MKRREFLKAAGGVSLAGVLGDFSGASEPAALDTGLLFDTRSYAVLSITHPADSRTPELNTDKDGDRVLIVIDGDLSLQIGGNRFRLGPGEAVQIPRGTIFGRSGSTSGAHLLLIRTKALRSFSMYR